MTRVRGVAYRSTVFGRFTYSSQLLCSDSVPISLNIRAMCISSVEVNSYSEAWTHLLTEQMCTREALLFRVR